MQPAKGTPSSLAVFGLTAAWSPTNQATFSIVRPYFCSTVLMTAACFSAVMAESMSSQCSSTDWRLSAFSSVGLVP